MARKNNKIPIAIMLLGTPGTGKTTISSHIIKTLDKKNKKNIFINFDALRKTLVPQGVSAFTHDDNVRKMIYEKAAKEFSNYLNKGFNIVIDCGLTREEIRKQLKSAIPQLKICHIHCPLLISIIRETKRSLLGEKIGRAHV